MTAREKLLSILVFIISVFFFLSDIGENSIRYSDEATHVRVVQEMIGSGAYLNPTLDAQPYLNKPPLKMLLTIAVVAVFGESNFSFRFIDGLCSAGIVAITFIFAVRLFGSATAGFLASFVLLGSYGFFYGGRFNTATQDAFVVFFNTAALWYAFSLYEAIRGRSGSRVMVLMAAFGLCLAAGVLAKSVVGVVPAVIILPLLFYDLKVSRALFSEYRSALILGIFAAAAPLAAYYAHVLWHYEDAWSRIFGYDIKARLFTEGFHNPEKWWFYLDRLFVQSEFCASWLLACALIFQLIKALTIRSFEHIFLASWAFLPLILFSSLQSRAFHYIGPAFPAFSLVITGLFVAAFSVLKGRSWQRGFAVRALCISLIVLGSMELGVAAFRAIKRAVSDKRKLPVELLVNDLGRQPELFRHVAEYDFSSFLEGDPYQRWRQQFYLDSFSRSRAVYTHTDQLLSVHSAGRLDVLFSSFNTGLKIIAGEFAGLKPCAYAPLWKPEAKRQSVKKDPGAPQALALIFSGCAALNTGSYVRPVIRNLALDSPDLSLLFGIGSRQQVAETYFWRMSSDEAVFSIIPDFIWSRLPTRFSIRAAVSRAGRLFPPVDVAVMINGKEAGLIRVAGGNFRDYEVDLPTATWRESDNLVMLRVQRDPRGPGLSAANQLLISSVKISIK